MKMETCVRLLSPSAHSQRSTWTFKAGLSDLPGLRVRLPLPGLFRSASFATQHRSALLFPCCLSKQQDLLTRNAMAKPPTEGSQEVLKNSTLILQPLRTSLWAHQQQNSSLETRSLFPAHQGPCQEK